MKNRKTVVGLGAAALAVTLTACGLSPQGGGNEETDQEMIDTSGDLSGEIQFQTWSLKNETFTPYFEDLIAKFEDEHPNVTVQWIDQPGEGYEEKILQQAQTQAVPDVVNLPPNFSYLLAKTGDLMNLDAADPEILDVYTPGGLGAYQYDGVEGTYGYPWYLGTGVNFWNTEVLDAAGVTDLPATNDELFAAAQKVAANDGPPLVSSLPGLGNLTSEGIPIFEDGKFVFNTPEAAAIVQLYVDAYEAGAMPAEVLSADYGGNATLYQKEQVAWTTATPSFPRNDLKKNAPSLLKVTEVSPQIGKAPLFVQGISVSAKSKHPEAALAFAQYVTNNANQVEFVKVAQGFLPGTVEATENPESFTSAIDEPVTAEAVAIASSAMATAESLQPVQWTDAMNTFFNQQVALAMRGDIPAQEALDKAAEHANSTMQ